MNFKNLIYIFILVITLASCGTSRRSVQLTEGPEITPAPMEVTEREGELEVSFEEVSKEVYSLGNSISEHAKAFLGTRYKFGGTTDKGMDCSGLVYTAFLMEDIELPRISREMSLLGSPLQLEEVGIGDLLFFETDRRKKTITHVGLVVGSDEEDIYFIHSTNSQGVIISSLKQPYWQNAFVLAKRVL